jgi:hypothetical protein
METPLIGSFVEKQYEIGSQAWSSKTIEGLASPSDCHKTAKIMFENQSRCSSSASMLMKSFILQLQVKVEFF